jgi:hypothetical protein
MDTLIIEGIVPSSFQNQGEFYLRICEEDQAKAAIFFDGIDTGLRSNSIAVRKKVYVKKCKAGDRVRYTLKRYHRKDGIWVKGISCEIL